MSAFATVDELTAYWRTMTPSETERAGILLDTVSAEIRVYAKSVGRDMDKMVEADDSYASVVKSVVMDTVARILNQSTSGEAFSQVSQTAGGYSASGTYLVPGGGSMVLNRDYKRLGLRRQRIRAMEVFRCRS